MFGKELLKIISTMHIVFLIISLNFAQVITHDIESRIVYGNATTIEKHPHSVFLYIVSGDEGTVCGGSIVNQKVVLTAAHCFDRIIRYARITATVGSSHARRGHVISVLSVRIHPYYYQTEVINDIALVGLESPIAFGSTTKRIALANKKPSQGVAKVAGWGVVEDFPTYRFSDYLHEISVPFISRKKCFDIFYTMNEGTFCGGKMRSMSYPAVGDSGSALVYKDYLQIGIVSYRNPSVSRSVIIYTDVAYYYKWIVENVKTVFCYSY